MGELTITPVVYSALVQLLLVHAGLSLDPGKEYLIRARLGPTLQRHQIASFEQLMERLRRATTRELLLEVVEAMVTTETSFFRDFHPFETLRTKVLPELIDSRREKRELNIWCGASSSGQEPYSIAMLIREHFQELDSWKVVLSSTDISREMLNRSREGIYSQLEVNRGLPATLLLKWFRQEGNRWHLDERIRSLVNFSQLNLTQAWPPMPTWDLVLLRNVMIYFEPETKASILERIVRRLAPDGYLLLGGAETTFNLNDQLVRIEGLKAGFYRRKE